MLPVIITLNKSSFSSIRQLAPSHHHQARALPDSDDLPAVQRDVIHLGNEDGCHGLIQRGAVHVNGGAYGQHEASHALINLQIFLQAAEGDG